MYIDEISLIIFLEAGWVERAPHASSMRMLDGDLFKILLKSWQEYKVEQLE